MLNLMSDNNMMVWYYHAGRTALASFTWGFLCSIYSLSTGIQAMHYIGMLSSMYEYNPQVSLSTMETQAGMRWAQVGSQRYNG